MLRHAGSFENSRFVEFQVHLYAAPVVATWRPGPCGKEKKARAADGHYFFMQAIPRALCTTPCRWKPLVGRDATTVS